MNNYEIKAKIVRAGESRIFNNWHEHTGVTMEAFLDGLKWLCDDPLNEHGRITRELCCLPDGTLVKIGRAYDKRGRFEGFYDINGKTITTVDGDTLYYRVESNRGAMINVHNRV